MTPTLRFRIIHERNALVSMEISFFALPSKQGPIQGRFKPAHLLISLSTRVSACVRRFETPIALNHGRTEPKKDISMLFYPVSFSGVFRGDFGYLGNLVFQILDFPNNYLQIFLVRLMIGSVFIESPSKAANYGE